MFDYNVTRRYSGCYLQKHERIRPHNTTKSMSYDVNPRWVPLKKTLSLPDIRSKRLRLFFNLLAL